MPSTFMNAHIRKKPLQEGFLEFKISPKHPSGISVYILRYTDGVSHQTNLSEPYLEIGSGGRI